MASTEQPVIDRLKSFAELTAIVGDRIAPGLRAQGDVLPAISYDLAEEAEPWPSLSRPSPHRRLTIIFRCWSEDYEQARHVASLVRDRLEQTSFAGITWCRASTTSAGVDTPDDGSGDGRRHSEVTVTAFT